MLYDLIKVLNQVKKEELSLKDDELRKSQTSELINAEFNCELELSHQIMKKLKKCKCLTILENIYGTKLVRLKR